MASRSRTLRHLALSALLFASSAALITSPSARGQAGAVAAAPVPAGRGEGAQEYARLVPFEQVSNFRDLGGYRTSDGKQVRWGRIYRSGALAIMTDGDRTRMRQLGVDRVIDLRTDEERAAAPDKVDGIAYMAVGYPFSSLIPTGQPFATEGDTLYGINRIFPKLLAPQLRATFSTLIHQDTGATVYHCTGGQDRTGFVSAMILAALGVPRETIIADYRLTPQFRRPRFEIPDLDPNAFPQGSAMHAFAVAQRQSGYWQPKPVDGARGPYLLSAFDEIDRSWGSVDNYLSQEVGLTRMDLQQLRAKYLM